VDTGYRAGAANQQAAPNHWTDAQKHYFRLIDGGFESFGHDAILAPCTYVASLLLNFHRFFSLSIINAPGEIYFSIMMVLLASIHLFER
jgi:hypothetical protein